MIKYLDGAPKVKVFERDIRKNGMTDLERLRRQYADWLAQQEWNNNQGGGDKDNPYIPDPPPPPESGDTECGDFNLDFSTDFFICDVTGDECGSFSDAFNFSFDNCDTHGGGGESQGGSYNVSYNRNSFDVYSPTVS